MNVKVSKNWDAKYGRNDGADLSFYYASASTSSDVFVNILGETIVQPANINDWDKVMSIASEQRSWCIMVINPTEGERAAATKAWKQAFGANRTIFV